jgi:hypothetical protein
MLSTLSEGTLSALDLFFTVFHTAVMAVIVFGWIPRRTRRLTLVLQGLTVFSWVGLGPFYGFGYCPLTDWHFRVLTALGERGLPRSYTAYLAERLTGYLPPDGVATVVTVGALGIALGASLGLYWRERNAARDSRVGTDAA